MSSLALKLTALVTMTIDHAGAVLFHVAEYRELSQVMRGVGRVAFPLYCFLIAEGMRRSKNRPRYLLWLGIFSIISIIPFSLFATVNFRGLWASPVYFLTTHHNVFFTLFFGAASVFVFDFIRGKIKGAAGYIAAFIGPAAASLAVHNLNSDYGRNGWGVLVIFLTYWVMSLSDMGIFAKIPETVWRFARVIPLLIWCHIQYHNGLIPEWVPFIGGTLHNRAVFAATAPLLVLLYDGTPGWAGLRGKMKVVFYAYYPVHLLAVYGFAMILRTL